MSSGLLSIWAEDYYWFSGRLLQDAEAGGEPASVDEAFSVMERLRARTLLETLEAAQAGDVSDRPDRATRSAFAVLPEVRTALAPDEALLSFQLGSDEDPRPCAPPSATAPTTAPRPTPGPASSSSATASSSPCPADGRGRTRSGSRSPPRRLCWLS